jgi:16S rRNA (cytidine1402-2'-O)-methyltransferase
MFDINNLNIELVPALYLIPTPIGNLDDITLRALKTISSVDMLACEDTRTTAQLLRHYGISAKRLTSYHEYNERDKSIELANMIEIGLPVGLVSDAGSPGISDPGYRIINETVTRGLKVIALPGANALIPAITSTGFPTNEFKFVGFPPQKKGRQTFLKNIIEEKCTVIMYESTHRIHKLINELSELISPDREICIGREISKLYEEFIRGTISEVKQILNMRKEIKGEIVVILRAE